MKGIIKLKNPIKVNGEEVKEVSFDTEEITAALYAEADVRKRLDAGAKNLVIIPSVEFDFALHAYIGYAAAIAVNPQYAFADMERMHGTDMLSFAEVGRNFLMKSEDVEQSNSGEQSETMPESSTQALQTSNENE